MRALSLSITLGELAQSNKNLRISGQVLLPLSSEKGQKCKWRSKWNWGILIPTAFAYQLHRLQSLWSVNSSYLKWTATSTTCVNLHTHTRTHTQSHTQTHSHWCCFCSLKITQHEFSSECLVTYTIYSHQNWQNTNFILHLVNNSSILITQNCSLNKLKKLIQNTNREGCVRTRQNTRRLSCARDCCVLAELSTTSDF